ncbi:MAG: serpin family protein [Myxococcales bacterium]|nr:serpin family protein [Myxococcales bacterium]
MRTPILYVAAALLTAATLATGACSSEPPRDPRVVTGLTPELAPVVAGNNAFALALYQAAAASPGNLFFSPFSVSAAFGMTYAGARGTTADEMRAVLAIGAEDASYHREFGALLADLGGPHEGRGYQLLVANRLFGQSGLPFEPPFLDLVTGAYAAPLEGLAFDADPEGGRAVINQWVSEQTEGRVPELFQSGDIDGATRLVAANAIYFKADWAKQFDPDRTGLARFTRADGTELEVPTMSQNGSFRGGQDDGVAFVELSYQDDELSMVLLVPDAPDGLPALEQKLDADYLAGLLAAGHEGEAEVALPRFELHARLPLAELVQHMGMVTAFDDTLADFSGMVATDVARLHLQTAVHEAFVRVDEQGTEAAAATGVGVGTTSMPPRIAADRPFVFLIRDMLTTSILFVGRIEDPTGIAF